MEITYTGELPWMWELELESGDSVYAFDSASDAISHGIMPMLGDYADDYDVDEIFDKLYDGFCDDHGKYWLVERWALEHPEWDHSDAHDYVWDIIASCDKGNSAE